MNANTTHCGHCHTCGTALRLVLDGEEWCATCQTYRRYRTHGWTACGRWDADAHSPCPAPAAGAEADALLRRQVRQRLDSTLNDETYL